MGRVTITLLDDAGRVVKASLPDDRIVELILPDLREALRLQHGDAAAELRLVLRHKTHGVLSEALTLAEQGVRDGDELRWLLDQDAGLRTQDISVLGPDVKRESGRVYVSHAFQDAGAAQLVCRGLEELGFDCWIAPRDIPHGQTWAGAVCAAIEASVTLLVLVTAHAESSMVIRRELELAAESSVRVVPLFVDALGDEGPLSDHLHGVRGQDARHGEIADYISPLADLIRSIPGEIEDSDAHVLEINFVDQDDRVLRERVPGEVPVGHLEARLVTTLGLPRTSGAGNLRLVLYHVRSGNELAFEQTLAEQGVRSQDEIALRMEPERTRLERSSQHFAAAEPRGDRLKHVFICHSSVDHAAASNVCSGLEDAGVRCWIAPRDIPAGARWSGSIFAAIRRAAALVVLVTPDAESSRQVDREVAIADKNGVRIVPLFLSSVGDDGDLGYYLHATHGYDARQGELSHHITALARELKT